MAKPKARFIHICPPAATDCTSVRLYALDEEGRVWKLALKEKRKDDGLYWILVTDERMENA